MTNRKGLAAFFVAVFAALSLGAGFFYMPINGGTGIDSSESTGIPYVKSGVWAVGKINTSGLGQGTPAGSTYIDGATGNWTALPIGEIALTNATNLISGLTSATIGGTGLNTSASTGLAQVAAGTWSVSSTVTAATITTLGATTVNAATVNATTGTITNGTITNLTSTKKILTPTAATTNATLTGNPAQVLIGAIGGNRTFTLDTPAAGVQVDVQDGAGNVSVQGNVTMAVGGASIYLNGVSNGTTTISTAFSGKKFVGVDATHWVCR